MDRIGIIRLSSLGDIILTEPVCACLKENFPKVSITFFTREIYLPVLEMCRDVDDHVAFQIPGAHERINDLRGALSKGGAKFDLVLDLHKNIRSRVIMNILRADEKLTYSKKRLFRQFAVWFKRKKKTTRTIDNYFSALDYLRLKISRKTPELVIPDEFSRKAEEYLAGIGFAADKYVVLAIGASHPPKQYPPVQFANLAVKIYNNYGVKILVVDSRWPQNRRIFDELKSKGIAQFGFGLDIRLLAALCKNARAVISNDSGVMHLAAATDVPTAGLFGPTHPVLGFAPAGDKSVAVSTDESCAPCSLHGARKCYRDKQYCFTNMTAEFILSRFEKYLR
jgi:ADP-heptose:LPS heptosyltransferase